MNKAIFLLFCLGLCHKSISKEWKLVWFPEANKDGLKAFEGVEDERGGVHKTTHIFVEDNNYRFNMHTEDRDTHTDRQRQEAKGMVTNGHQLEVYLFNVHTINIESHHFFHTYRTNESSER
jgi:hypothetical protein